MKLPSLNSHLNALFPSEAGLSELVEFIRDLIDEAKEDPPLQQSVKNAHARLGDRLEYAARAGLFEEARPLLPEIPETFTRTREGLLVERAR